MATIKCRIFRSEAGDGLPWLLDGIDTDTAIPGTGSRRGSPQQYARETEACAMFPTVEEALAAVPAFYNAHLNRHPDLIEWA